AFTRTREPLLHCRTRLSSLCDAMPNRCWPRKNREGRACCPQRAAEIHEMEQFDCSLNGCGALDTYIRKCVIFARILEIRVRVDLRYESGRGLRALQDASRGSGLRESPPGLGVRAVLCRFVALANADNSTLGFLAAPGLRTARPTFISRMVAVFVTLTTLSAAAAPSKPDFLAFSSILQNNVFNTKRSPQYVPSERPTARIVRTESLTLTGTF